MAEPTSPAGGKFSGKISRWFAFHPNYTLTLVVAVALVPFLAKPFNMDDTLFIWGARQIHAHPPDPYGFAANWFGTALPLWEDLWDPPLACYYLAIAGTVLGWSEVALHAACLLPALAVILGTYRLARHFCRRPMLAALATLFTPVFLVSSTTVMCDVLMLAFWIWAVVLWLEGMERDSFWRLATAALLVALAVMTKFFGGSLIPLLAAYSLIGKRRSAGWAICLLIPVATLLVYHWGTVAIYGRSLLFDAENHATAVKEAGGHSLLDTQLTVLTFTGACLASATFFAPLLWRARTLAAFAIGTFLLATTLFAAGTMFGQYPLIETASRLSVEIQIIFWATGGVGVLALAFAEIRQDRNEVSWLLFLWVLGTFLFTAFFNWDASGRSILPMAPAVGILIARRLEKRTLGKRTQSFAVPICVAASGVLAMLVARSDFLYAKAVRQSARQTYDQYGHGSETLWFEGHWGFQHYLEKLGASALDLAQSPLKTGDNLAIPANNTNLVQPKQEMVTLREMIAVPGPALIGTMNRSVGAGFYAAMWGPLPFVFGSVPPEKVSVYIFKSLPPQNSK